MTVAVYVSVQTAELGGGWTITHSLSNKQLHTVDMGRCRGERGECWARDRDMARTKTF